jgi:hypothetical protein
MMKTLYVCSYFGTGNGRARSVVPLFIDLAEVPLVFGQCELVSSRLLPA